ncbi:hypothetical protein FHX73_111197 [Kitasatospora viridis]|uniref:Uncharacterized protein n=1 Tax=Kitasatospora viridis TaxID=281105 RepID=A0A561UDH9_9ACTN|nr:hypothetical protein FHX73_111197 [Kitasatospora viridis]
MPASLPPPVKASAGPEVAGAGVTGGFEVAATGATDVGAAEVAGAEVAGVLADAEAEADAETDAEALAEAEADWLGDGQLGGGAMVKSPLHWWFFSVGSSLVWTWNVTVSVGVAGNDVDLYSFEKYWCVMTSLPSTVKVNQFASAPTG